MRPTGALHLGHYHGVLKNWLDLQSRYECYFFVVDWHALTTHYENPSEIAPSVWEMVIDWLAVGINPNLASLAIQSRIPEQAELHLLLSMVTPLGWLERVPSYKEQQQQLKNKDLSTYGFLGYPVLQAADVLLYKADYVPVGEDQVPHVEMIREIARRFNHIYGLEPDFADKVAAAVKKLGKKNAKLYEEMRRLFQEQGDKSALEKAHAVVTDSVNLTKGDSERLQGNLEGTGRAILVEPQVLLTKFPKVPGLDGQKMSKSYNNTLSLREEPDSIEQKIRTMQTDPARVRRSDPGEPEKCPVWDFHKIYSDEQTRQWVQKGCRSAGIGCLECKQPVIDTVLKELEPIRERGKELEQNPEEVRSIVAEGCESARRTAHDTIEEVRSAMGVSYR